MIIVMLTIIQTFMCTSIVGHSISCTVATYLPDDDQFLNEVVPCQKQLILSNTHTISCLILIHSDTFSMQV